jgi:hypothetical protein
VTLCVVRDLVRETLLVEELSAVEETPAAGLQTPVGDSLEALVVRLMSQSVGGTAVEAQTAGCRTVGVSV